MAGNYNCCQVGNTMVDHLADPSGGRGRGPGLNTFIFMQFSVKNLCQIIFRFLVINSGLAPPPVSEY